MNERGSDLLHVRGAHAGFPHGIAPAGADRREHTVQDRFRLGTSEEEAPRATQQVVAAREANRLANGGAKGQLRGIELDHVRAFQIRAAVDDSARQTPAGVRATRNFPATGNAVSPDRTMGTKDSRPERSQVIVQPRPRPHPPGPADALERLAFLVPTGIGEFPQRLIGAGRPETTETGSDKNARPLGFNGGDREAGDSDPRRQILDAHVTAKARHPEPGVPFPYGCAVRSDSI